MPLLLIVMIDLIINEPFDFIINKPFDFHYFLHAFHMLYLMEPNGLLIMLKNNKAIN